MCIKSSFYWTFFCKCGVWTLRESTKTEKNCQNRSNFMRNALIRPQALPRRRFLQKTGVNTHQKSTSLRRARNETHVLSVKLCNLGCLGNRPRAQERFEPPSRKGPLGTGRALCPLSLFSKVFSQSESPHPHKHKKRPPQGRSLSTGTDEAKCVWRNRG